MSAPKAAKRAAPTTSIATHTNDDIFIRDKSLCSELIGKLTFTEMIVFQMLGRVPTAAETAMIDACFVTLMEHGLTPSALATRLIYSSAPEAMQAGVAAGLMGVGSVFVGTMEGNAQLLLEIVDDPAGIEATATRIAEEHRAARKPLPGFGHHLHKPDDPRPIRLFQLAEEHGQSGTYIAALKALSTAIDRVYGKHITINATGAIAAVLLDCGVPAEILRGFALITRCAGLVGHVREEQEKPSMRTIWETSEAAIAYDGAIPEA
ncbi:MAG: citryl-CoA lyase [Alphaproteobacteria bacterium]|nr:citryl-CoA lyase [Alphaproteobacteria bacterium]